MEFHVLGSEAALAAGKERPRRDFPVGFMMMMMMVMMMVMIIVMMMMTITMAPLDSG
jgi:hypothetical protein